MSFDPHEADVDRLVDASMRMFERAKLGPIAAIQPRSIQRVLICPDGSSQDTAVAEAADFLRSRFDPLVVQSLDAREHESAGASTGPAAAAIPGVEPITAAGESAYDQILSAVETQQPDLVVLPCPFGREFESVGADSAGTVIDVLLRRSPVPLLVIRGPAQTLAAATRELVLVVGSENESEPAAAALALGLAASGSRLTLNLLVSQEQVENIRQLLGVLAPEQTIDREKLAGALAEAHAKLDMALHKAALEHGVQYRMDPQEDVTYPDDRARQLLLVLPLERDDAFGHGFVQTRIRQSPHPLLVVPRG
jgi:hypothetical protein